MLTNKQRDLLLFVHDHIVRMGVSPSFEEMKGAVGLRSKSGIHHLICRLEERGFIRRLAHRARSLEVVRLPDREHPGGEHCGGEHLGSEHPGARLAWTPRAAGFAPRVIQGNFRPENLRLKPHDIAASPNTNTNPSVAAIALPFYGRIAAGVLVEALQNPSLHPPAQTLDIPASMLGAGDYYALEVACDSMIDARIMPGDMVIIERCDTAETGAIIVAVIDGSEVVLKRLRRKGHSIALEPANPACKTRIFGPNRVKIQGRLIGLLRRYLCQPPHQGA